MTLRYLLSLAMPDSCYGVYWNAARIGESMALGRSDGEGECTQSVEVTTGSTSFMKTF